MKTIDKTTDRLQAVRLSLLNARTKIDLLLSELEDKEIKTPEDLISSVYRNGGKSLLAAFEHEKVKTIKDVKRLLATQPNELLKYRNVGLGAVRKMICLLGLPVQLDKKGAIV
jgi:hypothetical protein